MRANLGLDRKVKIKHDYSRYQGLYSDFWFDSLSSNGLGTMVSATRISNDLKELL